MRRPDISDFEREVYDGDDYADWYQEYYQALEKYANYLEAKAGQHETIVIGNKEISDSLFYDIIKEAKDTVETLYLCNEIEKKNLKRASLQDVLNLIKEECQ